MNYDKKNYEYVKCELCSKDKTKRIMVAHDLYNYIEGEFSVVKCEDCGFVYTNPRPYGNELLKYYPDNSGYYLPPNLDDLDLFAYNLNKKTLFKVLSSFLDYNLHKTNLKDKILLLPFYTFLKRRFEMEGIPKYVQNGRLLDVGCSYGLYLLQMKKMGWDVEGIEINKKAADYGREKLGLNIINDDFLNYTSDEKFDVITMRMVLEHLPNPQIQLQKANELLKKDGKLIIIVPNFDGIEFRLFKEYCYALQVPVHFNHFTPSTIQRFCDKTGFNIEKIVYQNFDRDIVASSNNMFLNTGNNHYINSILKNRHFRRSILKIIVNTLSVLGLTSRMTIWAKKSN